MTDAIEPELLDEIVFLTKDYSKIRKSNYKWVCENDMMY